jgi:predicted enzyme related to lactoylglutathione lyase
MRKSLPGKFLWFELFTHDIAKAKAFYADVVGWSFRSFPAGPGTIDMIFFGEGLETMVGSIAPAPGTARWLSCVSVDGLDAALARATANGGAIVEPISELPGIGRRATIRDPQGVAICLFERVQDDKPDVAWAKPGEFFWNELRTTDPRAAVDFYSKVLGYTHETMGDYRVLSSAAAGRGGVQRLEGGGAPHWLPYVMTEDVDATMAKVDKAGGSVVTPATDIPGIGRYGVLRDPGGALLAVMKPAPRMKKP